MVECYDCHQQVADLKQHRRQCSVRVGRTGRSGLTHQPGTVECYDCHQWVKNIKDHRQTCLQSRRAKSLIQASEGASEKASVGAEVRIKKRKRKDLALTKDFYALLDVSSSMKGHRLDEAKSTFRGLEAEMDESDRLAIVTFDTKAFFKLKPRSVGQVRRQDELGPLLGRIFARGATAIWDAIYISVSQIQDKTRETVMLVLTDGEDNSSSHSYHDCLALVSQYPKLSLSIIHIGKRALDSYQQICDSRGDYQLINEWEIKVTLTSTFRKYWD